MKKSKSNIKSIFLVLVFFLGGNNGLKSWAQQGPFNPVSQNIIPVNGDSTVTVAAGPHYERSFFHNLLFGKHYRHLWTQPVEMKVFDIGSMGDSLHVVKRGGGQQTLNLRLKDTNKKEYVLRTVDKDQTYALPERYRTGILKFFLRDQTSAMNPYAALAVPPLAEAAGILHVKPELYYVPYDERFGEYAKLIAGRVVIFEQFPEEPHYKNADKVVGTSKFLERRFDEQDVVFDEKQFARSRLFDLLIGDWDRHRDQWRWAEYREDGKRYFKPVPRDRDMVFYRFNDGLITFLASRWFLMPKLQTFDFYYGEVENMTLNSKYTDNLLLMSLDEKDWILMADSLKTALTDEIIENAVKQWPEEIYELEGRTTIAKLKSRRNSLDEAAKEFYRILNERVALIGTDMEESFEVKRLSSRYTSVIISDKEGNIMFNRVFDNRTTKSICLYGLSGNDHFLVTGTSLRSPFINIYGGKGEDSIVDRSKVKNSLKKHTAVFDTPEGNHVEFGDETADKRTNAPYILDIDREGFNQEEEEAN